MAYLGVIQGTCGEETPYTREGNCPVSEKPTTGLLLTGPNADYDIDAAAFMAGLPGYVASQGSDRVYPISKVVAMPINGGDVNAPDLGTYGGPRPTNLNARNIGYQIDGGDCLYKELSKLNGRKMRIMRFDNSGMLYNTAFKKNDAVRMRGFDATIYVTKTPPDGSAGYNLTLWAYFTPNNEAEERNLNGFMLGLENFPDGLLGVMLKAGAAGSVKVISACGGDDLTAEWGDKWKPSMFVNESGIAATTATYNSTTGALNIAPAGKYRVADANILKAGEIDGLSGVPQYVTVSS